MGLRRAEVEDFPLAAWAHYGRQHGIDNVIDIVEVAPLFAASVQLDGSSAERVMKEDGGDPVPLIANSLARTVGVRKPKDGRVDSVDAVVEQVIILGRQLVDTIDVDRKSWVVFGDRQP